MAAVLSGLRPRKILVDVEKIGSGDVARGVRAPALLDVHQVMARVEDDPLRVVQVRGQLLRRDQHSPILSRTLAVLDRGILVANRQAGVVAFVRLASKSRSRGDPFTAQARERFPRRVTLRCYAKACPVVRGRRAARETRVAR